MNRQLSLVDQCFIIFKDCPSLSKDELLRQLHSKFNTQQTFEIIIKCTRFIHPTTQNKYKMYIREEDICPYGFHCSISMISCGCIHCASNELQLQKMSQDTCPTWEIDNNDINIAIKAIQRSHYPESDIWWTFNGIKRIYSAHTSIHSTLCQWVRESTDTKYGHKHMDYCD